LIKNIGSEWLWFMYKFTAISQFVIAISVLVTQNILFKFCMKYLYAFDFKGRGGRIKIACFKEPKSFSNKKTKEIYTANIFKQKYMNINK
jgi:hypothetical protein